MKGSVRTFATAVRVLRQVKNDHRTIVLLLVVPSLLIGLLNWTFNDQEMFNRIGPAMLGLFPFTIMFVLTSITTLVERRSGTLERFLTMPLRKGEFIFGYALAFGFLALLQALITLTFCVWVLDLEIQGEMWLLALVAVVNALLGMSLGLMASAFAATEFQVMQLMPAFIFPQILVGGIFVPVERMPDTLQAISNFLPMTHAISALNELAFVVDSTETVLQEVGIIVAFIAGALALGALTLKRKTP
jgi:ABC transporter DrrB family efflux protein